MKTVAIKAGRGASLPGISRKLNEELCIKFQQNSIMVAVVSTAACFIGAAAGADGITTIAGLVALTAIYCEDRKGGQK